MRKEAVGANARRAAKLVTARPALLRQLTAAAPAAAATPPPKLPRLMSNLLGQTSPSRPADTARAIATAVPSGSPRNSLSSNPRLRAKELAWADEATAARLVAGRHAGQRQLYDAATLSRLPEAGGDYVYRGFRGAGTPFYGSTTTPGTALFTSGRADVPVTYGVPEVAVGVGAARADPRYVVQLRPQTLETAGPAGPWTPHLGMDTRRPVNRLLADVLRRLRLDGPLARLVRGNATAADPKFERVFTTPTTLRPAVSQAFKYVGQGPDGRHLFVRVAGGGGNG